MDDLSGLDWSSSSSANKSNASQSSAPTFSYPSMKPTSPPPLSGRSTPLSLSAQASGRPASNAPSKSTTPANDSFSSLLSRNNAAKQNANLSMQERQKQLLEEKARQEEERRKKLDHQFGANDNTFWENIGSGKSTPDPTSAGLPKQQGSGGSLSATINKPFAALNAHRTTPANTSSESDLLAAFDSDAPVDSSSHFPPAPDSRSSTPAHAFSNGSTNTGTNAPTSSFDVPDEDDDPFGLGSLPQKQSSVPRPAVPADDDDDVLGLLGKPVSERPAQSPQHETTPELTDEEPPSLEATDPRDKAVAELVDMGFPADQAAVALSQTDTGVNVQAAVSLLLNAAHEEARQKARGNAPERRPSPRFEQEQDEPRSSRQERGDAVPAWMRNERPQSGQRRQNSQSPAPEKDVTQYASEFGSTLFKSANTLWKTGQKKVQRAVAEFNQEAPADPSQPKWMRDVMAAEQESAATARRQKQPDNVTDEAMMLETPPKPKPPPRQVPPVSPTALATSGQHRQAGSDAFKRGDYGAAHTSYSAALHSLGAPNHPVAIVILCNRATTSLKNGDPKAAVADSDNALGIIGPGLGSGEKIGTGAGGEEKEMREFYGKALMKKAEALEHLEKWADAAMVWRLAVEAGVGGSVSIQGRNRCEKAAGGGGAAANGTSTPGPASTRQTPAKTRPKPVPRPVINTAKSAEAVKQLRAANAAAEKADDEKFALSDSVDAKLIEWKGSKADNLRALLGSLDKVLWPEAGWKKVGMQDLVLPNKCKVVYMKAIGKVHPDKIAQDATTEQKMISAAVFSTLNEAWDKFKQENGL
ncbi:hypothetical protein NA57DRAFT_43372 [Rhizodiscina lignyota]|uniref:UBA domain-containing protein n=1 Tax=Rhizodiscina lignyota TaxID=1504668 RepID=A0A9P4IBS0_9PEZI|nr:hypothetical protein NA57DRAFT_43372 [Rhizodiscina lignyota]